MSCVVAEDQEQAHCETQVLLGRNGAKLVVFRAAEKHTTSHNHSVESVHRKRRGVVFTVSVCVCGRLPRITGRLHRGAIAAH